MIRSCCPGYITDALYRVENLDRYDDRLQVTTNLIEAYDLLMEFVAKHTSDKFCLINNISTSIRGIISREVIGNILVHRDYSSAYPAKVIIECSALEGGCRNNEMIEDIEKCLNTKLKQEIYCPIDDKIEIEIIKICNNLKKSDFYKFGQKILCNLLLKYGFKLNLLVNLKKADVNDIDGIITIRNKDSVINLSVDKSMVSDIRQYNMVHRYPNREYFFLNTKGKKITSSSALATIQEKLEEVNNINTTTLALKGVSKLIQKGLTLSEIKYLTGFETKKIEDVSRWLMNQEDVESVINNKLNLIDI